MGEQEPQKVEKQKDSQEAGIDTAITPEAQKQAEERHETLRNTKNAEIEDKVKNAEEGALSYDVADLADLDLNEHQGFFGAKYATKRIEDKQTGKKSYERLNFQKDYENSIEKEFAPGTYIDVDFGGDKKAEQTVGAGDILPTEVQVIKVIDADGTERVGVRKASGVKKVGYYDNEGDYIPVFTGDTIYIPTEDEVKQYEKDGLLPGTKINGWSLYWNGTTDELKHLKEEEIEHKKSFWGKVKDFEKYSKMDFEEYLNAHHELAEAKKEHDALSNEEKKNQDRESNYEDKVAWAREVGLEESDYDRISKLFGAISTQESGGNYHALGQMLYSGSFEGQRAVGRYQIMLGNWVDWSKELNNGKVLYPTKLEQDHVAFFKMASAYKHFKSLGETNPDNLVKLVAVTWYGNMGKRLRGVGDISNKKPSYGPSPLGYANSVLGHYRNQSSENRKMRGPTEE